jgi:hypothetical protein
VTNRSAKDGARSSWHYGSEGVLTHPSYQGVCGRHGTEDLDVTPGGLVVFSGGTGISDPISRETKWEVKRGELSDSRIVPQKPGERRVTAQAAAGWVGEGGWQR